MAGAFNIATCSIGTAQMGASIPQKNYMQNALNLATLSWHFQALPVFKLGRYGD